MVTWPCRPLSDGRRVRLFWPPLGIFCFCLTLKRFATINFQEIFRIFSNFSMQNHDFSGKIQKGGVAFLLNYANFMLIYFFQCFVKFWLSFSFLNYYLGMIRMYLNERWVTYVFMFGTFQQGGVHQNIKKSIGGNIS